MAKTQWSAVPNTPPRVWAPARVFCDGGDASSFGWAPSPLSETGHVLFGRARFVEHGWNESRHSSTEGLLLYALRQGGVRRGTFPTLSAVGCCVGERCESFQANRQCHMLCLGPGTAALAVKYKYEGWLAAAHAATLQVGTRNRTIVPCSKGLCIEGAPKPSWACARVRRAVGGLPCPSFPRWLALEPTGTSAARQMACNNVDADAASSP